MLTRKQLLKAADLMQAYGRLRPGHLGNDFHLRGPLRPESRSRSRTILVRSNEGTAIDTVWVEERDNNTGEARLVRQRRARRKK